MSSCQDPRREDDLGLVSREHIEKIADEMDFPTSVGDIDASFHHAMTFFECRAQLTQLQVAGPPLRYANRSYARRPSHGEDPYNAIFHFCEVTEADTGPLIGIRIGVKDNISVAGIPMTLGRQSAGPLPLHDDLVVERLLDAGATIAAKTNISGSAFDETRNPHNPRYSPGFSSSGSAAAVAAGMLDGALGTDLAGSVRIPAAWCGVVAMKPTDGLIPRRFGHGADGVNQIGPITTSVLANATMLQAMARSDSRDSASSGGSSRGQDYATLVGANVHDLRVGVIAEAVEPGICGDGVLRSFDGAKFNLTELGAGVSTVSIPLWAEAASILRTLDMISSAVASRSPGIDLDYDGWVDESFVYLSAAPAPDQTSNLLAEIILRRPVLAAELAHVQNVRAALRSQIDELLSDVDLLVTPTTPIGPVELPIPWHSARAGAWTMVELVIRNTVPLNLTGHPALSIPSGPGDNEMPTGLQLIGRRFDESTVYRAAFAYEAMTRSSLARSSPTAGTGGADSAPSPERSSSGYSPIADIEPLPEGS